MENNGPKLHKNGANKCRIEKNITPKKQGIENVGLPIYRNQRIMGKIDIEKRNDLKKMKNKE